MAASKNGEERKMSRINGDRAKFQINEKRKRLRRQRRRTLLAALEQRPEHAAPAAPSDPPPVPRGKRAAPANAS